MKWLIQLLFCLSGPGLFAQSLASKNFRDWYDPDAEVKIALQAVRHPESVEVFYQIESTAAISNYNIAWEKRDTFAQREGVTLTEGEQTIAQTEKIITGSWPFELPQKPWLLVVKVTNTTSLQNWIKYIQIEATYPVSGWITKDREPYFKKYLGMDEPFELNNRDNKIFHASFYNEDFPAALPPFADKDSRADRFLFHDSTFRIQPGASITLRQPGLYLFQKDTNAAEGVMVRVTGKGYPKYNRIEDLAKPLIYICTPDEFTELQNANGEKARFDKVILDITQNKDRASTFIRNYFRRVELANLYFSSYKEGWKTDRGMVYLIFGLPDEVAVNDGTEAWYYKNTKNRFTFVRSASVYDPHYYVLLRDKRFMSSWYSTIDLWRKSRF
jgi:GWxTD domain-containing protein